MPRRDIRIVDLGEAADPPPQPARRRRWVLWAAGGIGLAAVAGSAIALLA
jgi:hypothetical protein